MDRERSGGRDRGAGALALLALGAALAALTGCGGARSSEQAGAGASSAPAASAPAAGGAGVMPAPAESSAAAGNALGAEVFHTRCALCHGPTGHGDGPGGKALNPRPRNFHDTAYMSSRTDEQLLATIHTGKGAMPRWGGVLSEQEIHAVLAYIRELGKRP